MSYKLTLTSSEHRALAWVADRYGSAEILYDGMVRTDDDDSGDGWGGVFDVPEHVAWNYAEELPRDNGVESALLPPCAGGSLAGKLIGLLDGIV